MRTFILLLTLSCLAAGVAQAQKAKKPVYLQYTTDNAELPNVKNRWDRFQQQILGHFGNQRFVREHPELGEKHQEFIIIPIMRERTGEFWVYLEYFSPLMHDAPIDQRVEQYVRLNRDTIRMEVYYLKDPSKYINEWLKPNPFEGFTKDELVRDYSCDLLILSSEDQPHFYQTIIPTTETLECRLKNPIGASQYIALWFELQDRGYNMRFMFYDKNKQLVTPGNIIEFDRLDWHAKDYSGYAPASKPK